VEAYTRAWRAIFVAVQLDRRGATRSLEFLEAAYAWDRPDDRWLSGVVHALCELWGGPVWGFGFFYDASDLDRFTAENPVFYEIPAEVQALFGQTLAKTSSDFAARTYRTLSFGFVNPFVGPSDSPMQGFVDRLGEIGTRDMFALNGLDPSGIGCVVGVGVARTVIAPEEMLIYQRLAGHLASAYRCRRALKAAVDRAGDDAEAILDADGRLLDARGPARAPDARRALGAATRAIEGVRRGQAGGEPTLRWRPRVQARWTLVDSFNRDGARYILARENRARAPGLGVLTEREQQVVACAASGKTNKEIAYELGISHATTRVLVARACARLGVRTRLELLRLPSIRALRGEARD
jgi:DNA-binding CsgD family transcriptional regulator